MEFFFFPPEKKEKKGRWHPLHPFPRGGRGRFNPRPVCDPAEPPHAEAPRGFEWKGSGLRLGGGDVFGVLGVLRGVPPSPPQFPPVTSPGLCEGFNIDVGHPRVFQGPPESQFGYRVLQWGGDGDKW